MDPEISVVVVTWQSAQTIEACLSSLQASVGPSLEIILVDNGSTDSTVELALAVCPDLILIRTGRNLGFSAASNLGMGRARGSFILQLNPDAVVEPDTVKLLSEFLRATPQAAVVAPKVVDPEGDVDIYTARELPTLLRTLFRQFGITRLMPRNRIVCGDLPLLWNSDQILEAEYLCGAVTLVRRDFLSTTGFLNNEIPMYFDDLDLSARAIKRGLKSYFLPAARAGHIRAHSASLSSQRALLHMLEDGQAPWLYFYHYRSPVAAASFRAIVGVGSLTRATALVVSRLFAWSSERRTRNAISMLKVRSLLVWSILPKRSLERRISEVFAWAPETT